MTTAGQPIDPVEPIDRIAEHKRRWADSPFMRAQGLEIEELGAGEVVLRLPQALPMQRGGGGSGEGLAGVINGGVVAYMFDGALGYSVISGLLALPQARGIDPRELRQFTINLDITYLDAAHGDTFEARGKVTRLSRSTAFAEGVFLDGRGRVCATAKGIWRVFWPRPPAPSGPVQLARESS